MEGTRGRDAGARPPTRLLFEDETNRLHNSRMRAAHKHTWLCKCRPIQAAAEAMGSGDAEARHTSRVTRHHRDDDLLATCHKRWWSHVTSISCNCFHNTKTVENPPQAFVKNCSPPPPWPVLCWQLGSAAPLCLHPAEGCPAWCLSVCLSVWMTRWMCMVRCSAAD